MENFGDCKRAYNYTTYLLKKQLNNLIDDITGNKYDREIDFESDVKEIKQLANTLAVHARRVNYWDDKRYELALVVINYYRDAEPFGCDEGSYLDGIKELYTALVLGGDKVINAHVQELGTYNDKEADMLANELKKYLSE